MKNAIIKLEGQEVKLYPDTVITQSLKAFRIGEISKRDVNFTNRISCPRKPNDAVFENAGSVSSETLIPYRKKMATITQNGIDVVPNGIFSLDEVTEKSYEFSIFSGAKGFFETIQGRKLSDIEGFAFYSDPADVAIDVSAKRNTTSGVIYPVAYAGTFDTPSDIIAGILSGIYLKSIVDNIFSQAGYDKSGSVFSDGKYLKKIVMCTGNSGKYQSSFIESRTVDAYVNAVQGPTLVPGGNGLNVDFNGTRRLPSATSNPVAAWDGEYYTASDPDITPGATTDPVLYTLKVKFSLYIVVTGGTVNINTAVDDIPYSSTGLVNLGTGIHTFETEGDRYIGVSTSIFPKLSISITINSGAPTVTINSGFVSIGPDGNVPNYNNFPAVYHAAILPEMTQADLLRDLAIGYGLIFEEKNGTVYAKSFDEIIADRANAKNWTSKRVGMINDSLNFTPLEYAQRNFFKYGGDAGGGEFYGSGEFGVDNENVELEKTIYTSPFTNTDSVIKSGILMASIPVYDEIPTTYGVLEFSSSQGNKMLLVRDPYTGEPNVTYPDAVGYSDYKVVYFDDPQQSDTMFLQQDIEENYPLLIECLQRAKIVTRDYMLTELDIANFSFFFPIFDSGEYFLVNEVKNFIQSGVPTTVELFKV